MPGLNGTEQAAKRSIVNIDMTDITKPIVTLLGPWNGRKITAAMRQLEKAYRRQKFTLRRRELREAKENDSE